jgi:ubiquinone/menaquinone biosynthesis C-methylase UbiE
MSCCNQDNKLRSTVQDKYGELAKQREPGSCCNKKAALTQENQDNFAKSLGYTADDLEALPEGANMGLSCGNPTAMASLQQGEVVVDLGSGGGFDVFIAARKIGNSGRAIGVDMTPPMLHKARDNAIKFTEKTGLNNVEFRLGEIEHLPVADNSVNVIISNCVINLSPDKEQVWREVARVLKPGGRACVSDITLLKPLPDALRASIHALVGCIAGAVLLEETHRMVEAAGLQVTSAEKEAAFVHNMERSDDPLYKNVMDQIPEGTSPRDFVTSLRLVVTKPSS